jgi:hypothetical protein
MWSPYVDAEGVLRYRYCLNGGRPFDCGAKREGRLDGGKHVYRGCDMNAGRGWSGRWRCGSCLFKILHQIVFLYLFPCCINLAESLLLPDEYRDDITSLQIIFCDQFHQLK